MVYGPFLNRKSKSRENSMSHAGFTVQYRAIGRVTAWAAFILAQAYAVASGLGFLSLKSPQDAVGDPFLFWLWFSDARGLYRAMAVLDGREDSARRGL